MSNYSTEIAEAIKENLEEGRVKMVAFDEKKGAFSFVIHSRGVFSILHYIIRVGDDSYTVAAFCPLKVPVDNPEILAALAEFSCRANYGLPNGKFELDYTDGELQFTTYVDCEDQVPSQSIITNSIVTPAATIRRYAPGIRDVLFDGKSPETAVEECEGFSRRPNSLLGSRSLDREEAEDTIPSYEEFDAAESAANEDPEEEDGSEIE